ncbi:hypothetical protein PPERSA_11641 [Pseudocohnilembus persalinus]|uniref:Alpha/beta hydrolase fold-3 domain-containing protein n=1 Tax=Pseudocohnilembus persalinus TaxID=266149 RepID=A0A0V0QA45_PSEPJ|nr:hypothetical protein PPERSA_11641 [Pseudocohnilembus persalinus]|eukprot:KRW99040.1 hypothetical protein PPERSA_11641 [Pseudocohnilembus persalinus]
MPNLKRTHIYNDGSEITTQNTDLQISALRHIIKIIEIFEHLFKKSENSITYNEEYQFLKHLEEEFQVTIAHVYQAVQRKKHGQHKNINSQTYIAENQKSNTSLQIQGEIKNEENNEKMHHNENDIIQQPPQAWKSLEEKIQYSLIFDSLEILENQMHHFLHMVSLTVSTCYATKNAKNFIVRQIQETFYTALFKLSRNLSFKETNKFLGDSDSNTQIQTAIRIWNGMDKIYALRYFIQATCFEYIQYHKKLYMPRIFESLTLEQIFEWQKNNSFDEAEEIKPKQNWDKDIYEKQNKLKKVKVRLICGKELEEKQKDLVQKESFLTKITHKINTTNFKKELKKDIDTVIIHIHGGGWVSMSSFTHQMYTRKWANYKELKGIPIFSIDYRKSPKYAYPCALDDCFQVYLFIVHQIHNYYNINPKNIILTGDSAGGNMCLGIVQLCMKYNIQLPKFILLSYPAMNLSASNYTPSINFAFDDLICPFQFMKMCQSLLIQHEQIDPDRDPLISPLLMSDKNLKKLPPIKMYMGENDSLKDDTIRFLKRLQENDHQQSDLLIYTGLKHGYLNWDVPFGIRLARKCIDDASEAMLQFYKQDLNPDKK